MGTETPGLNVLDLSQTLASFVDYLTRQRRLSENTVASYSTDVRQFVRWYERTGCALAASALDKRLVAEYVAQLAHLAPNSVRRKVSAISSWLQFLVRLRKLPSNPVTGLPLPRRTRRLPQFPTAQETQRILSAARTPVERVVVWLLATTGLRRGELLGLDVRDVSLDTPELRVVGKGGHHRSVPLPDKTRAVLQEYLQARGSDMGPLLLSRAGTRLGVTSLRRAFCRLLRRAGLAERGFTLHSMRHGFATMLLRNGTDLRTIQDLLGHTDISVTAAYLHTDATSRRDAVNRLPVLAMDGEGDE